MDTHGSPSDRWRLAWLLLGVCYLLFAFLYSVIQPLSAIPDEVANMQYVRWLTTEHHLPPWVPTGRNLGGGGYESQHPPLAYSLNAVPYALSSGLAENWRWQVVRWFMVLLGLSLLWPLAQVARRLFPGRPLPQIAYVGTVALMPGALLHLCHANPDGIGLILSATGLWLALKIHDDPREDARLPILAGLLGALAALTKLSVMPVGLALLAAQWMRPGQTRPGRLRACAIILCLWLVGAGWWYARNVVLYGTPFLHTQVAALGPGLALAAREGAGKAAAFTLSRTFLSTWVQRGWFPLGWDVVLYGLIFLLLLLALAGWLRRQATGMPPSRFAWGLCIFLPLFVLTAQQSAFWMVDMELNAGGRYMLIALPAIAALLVGGVVRLGPRATGVILPLWLAALLVMNIASAYNLVDNLTPTYFPGWRMFEFPGGAPP